MTAAAMMREPTPESILEMRCTKCGALCYFDLAMAERIGDLLTAPQIAGAYVRHAGCTGELVPHRVRLDARAPWLPYLALFEVEEMLDHAGWLGDPGGEGRQSPHAPND